jgi:hypothetical protein
MNLRHHFVSAVIVVSLFGFGCSKKEGSQSASSSAQPQQAVAKVDPRAQFGQMFTKPELVKLGENIYQTKGMQTCLQCHRSGGEGEGFAGAAHLVAPNTFRSFNALGGYDALAKNPKEFREKLETSLLYLIHFGLGDTPHHHVVLRFSGFAPVINDLWMVFRKVLIPLF